MTQEEYRKRLADLAWELDEIDQQISGLYALKKQKKTEIRDIKNKMVERAREGKE